VATVPESTRGEHAQLRAELDERERELTGKERQLERYASDLRDTFIEERARARELRSSYVATVRALTNAVEARDAYTGKHAERVAAYALEIASALDSSLIDDPQVEFGFLLHDIGKVAIPDSILHKPQPLSREERALMQRHTVIGWEILEGIEFLSQAREVVRWHHERWDGKGYPDGLEAERIPLAARVFGPADALDAITTDRPYRHAAPLAAAREQIGAAAGTQFDPAAVEALLSLSDDTLGLIRREHS
jgi:putative nucleotidyltransferase with HDIG domain